MMRAAKKPPPSAAQRPCSALRAHMTHQWVCCDGSESIGMAGVAAWLGWSFKIGSASFLKPPFSRHATVMRSLTATRLSWPPLAPGGATAWLPRKFQKSKFGFRVVVRTRFPAP